MVFALIGILIETNIRGIRRVASSCAAVFACRHRLMADGGLLVVGGMVVCHAAWQRHTNPEVLRICLGVLADKVRILVSLDLSRERVALAEEPTLLDFLLLTPAFIFATFRVTAALVRAFLRLALAHIYGCWSSVGPLAAVVGTIVVEPLQAEAHATP